MIANKEMVDNACKISGDTIIKLKEQYEKSESDIELYLKEKELWHDFLEWKEFKEVSK